MTMKAIMTFTLLSFLTITVVNGQVDSESGKSEKVACSS